MIAARATHPAPHARHLERGRTATRRRVRRARRRGYVGCARVAAMVSMLCVPVMLYVMLTANVTSLNYKLARAESAKNDLLAQTMRQEDQIAKLESRERLARIAAKLGMREPQSFAVATLQPAHARVEPARGVALLGAVNNLLSRAVADVGK